MRAGEAGSPELELDKLLSCAAKWKDQEVLVYGFTYVIWTQLIQPLKRQGITLDLPNVRILHSGGWKRLEHQSVTRDVFNREVAAVFGSFPNRVIDYYGMVENVGVIYPDCEYGNKHVPAFADVIIRDPLTLAPLGPGRKGLIQVCSVLPTSFPGFLLLTEDTAELMGDDNCSCGRLGPSFRFAGRLAKAEVRGCGNLESTRHREPQLSGVA
jgi:phenylacetate-coenzyme A ligase PaaK-like adenylate-forming protein